MHGGGGSWQANRVIVNRIVLRILRAEACENDKSNLILWATGKRITKWNVR